MAAAIGFILLLAVGLHGAEASGRTILQAPAPAPAAAKGAVNGVFELTAAQATFVNGTSMALTGLPNTTAWVQFTPTPSAGARDLGFLVTSAVADSSGNFLGSPQASLSGLYSGNSSTVLLQLNAPKLDAKTKTIYFNYTVLPANETSLPATGGTVNTLVAAQNGAEGGTGSLLLPYVTPGSTKFINATLTIDVVGIQDYVSAAGQKAGLIHVPLGGCCYGWGWGFWG